MPTKEIRRNYLIRNQTPYRVTLRSGDDSLTLAPLQSRRIGVDPISRLGAVARAAHDDQVIDWEQEPLRATRLVWATWLAVVGISAAAIGTGAYLLGDTNVVTPAVGGGIAVLCALGGAYSIGQGRHSTAERVDGHPSGAFARHRVTLMWVLGFVGVAGVILAAVGAVRNWPLPLVIVGVGIAMLYLIFLAYCWGAQGVPTTETPERPTFSPTPIQEDAWGPVRDFMIATAYGLVVVMVIVVAVAAPAMAIYYGTELSTIIVFTGWNHPSLVSGQSAQYIVVGRLLQLFLLVLVSLVPALMFFQFDREKLSTLVDRWLHAIFRLDPSLETVADVDAKYGRRVEEFYGATLGLGVIAVRKRLRDRSPVVVATLLIAIGWILVLLSQKPVSERPSFQDLYKPPATPMTLAFLGAYFLSVQVALRGYVRGDLKPKTYNVITVRILMAIVLAWTLQALWGTSKLSLGLAFLSGIVPNTVLRWIRESIENSKNSFQGQRKKGSPGGAEQAGREGISAYDELSEKSPLSQLDDVDIYDRTRLEEEGITSVQALARHDLVDLILSSRIPVPRLIDWMDQAVLHQHAPGAISTLGQFGVRTATDYLKVYADETARAQLAGALAEKHPGVLVDVLRVVLEGDEWVGYLKNWRLHDGTEPSDTIIYGPGSFRQRRQGSCDEGRHSHATGPATSPNGAGGTSAHGRGNGYLVLLISKARGPHADHS